MLAESGGCGEKESSNGRAETPLRGAGSVRQYLWPGGWAQLVAWREGGKEKHSLFNRETHWRSFVRLLRCGRGKLEPGQNMGVKLFLNLSTANS